MTTTCRWRHGLALACTLLVSGCDANSQVFEVGLGADLVAREYESLINTEPGHGYISSDCPAIVAFVEKYHPELIGSLTPVVSPMVATSRYIRQTGNQKEKLVFIGPCIAKKEESEEVDEVITFTELREMFTAKRIRARNVEPSSAPDAGTGSNRGPPARMRRCVRPVIALAGSRMTGLNQPTVDGTSATADISSSTGRCNPIRSAITSSLSHIPNGHGLTDWHRRRRSWP